MGSRQGHQNSLPPEIVANFRELFPEHEDLDDFIQDQETVYRSLQVIGNHSKDLVPNNHHNSNSRNQSVDDGSISRTDSINSDVDVALTLSMLELDAQSEVQNVSISESSQSTAGNRGPRNTGTSVMVFLLALTSEHPLYFRGYVFKFDPWRYHTMQVVDYGDVDPDTMTYEELQSLGDAIGTESRGLSEKVLSRLPSRKFKGKSGWFSSKTKSQPQECVICSEEYASGELLTTLHCKHRYHKECIGKWFSSHKTCPICKTEIS